MKKIKTVYKNIYFQQSGFNAWKGVSNSGMWALCYIEFDDKRKEWIINEINPSIRMGFGLLSDMADFIGQLNKGVPK